MLRHYLLLSLKVLARRKFFTFISIFGISFTLMVLMLVTAWFDHVFAPMRPETRQRLTLESRRVLVFKPGRRGNWNGLGAFDLYDRYARNLPGVEHLSIYSDHNDLTTYLDGRKIVSSMKRTDSEFWNILEFDFLEGRPFTKREVDDVAFVAVINATTRERFFGTSSALGKTLDVDGQRFRVIGVVKDVSVVRDVANGDIIAPITTFRGDGWRGSILGNFKAILLASNRAAFPRIRQEFAARIARIDATQYREGRLNGLTSVMAAFDTKFDAFARNFPPITDPASPDPQGWRLIAMLSTLALLFVLLPTVNLVNINVSRIMERASEIGIRKAFGAANRTLIAQFVIENVVLTLAGGAGGLVLSALVLRAMTASGVVPYAVLGINWRVFGYGFLMAVAFGVMSGVYPAWRMSRLHPAEALHGGRR